MSEALDHLLVIVRQHPAFRELLATVPAPEMPRYRPTKPNGLENLGASTAYASGARDQHERWTALFTGSSQKEQL